MQDCFRKYPDVYGAEIADEEAAEQEAEQLALDIPTPDASAPLPKTERNMAATPADTAEKPAAPTAAANSEPSTHEEPEKKSAPAVVAAPSTQEKQSEVVTSVGTIREERGVPEKAFDATGANGKQ